MRRLAVLLAALLVGSAVAAVPATGAEGTTIDHDGDTVTLSAGPAQQIGGQTDLAAGETVTVRVNLDNTSTPLIRQQTATVDEDGSFAVTVDLYRADPGATGNVTVVADGDELARTPLTITECDGDCEPVPTESPEEDSPFSFDGESITLSAAPGQEISGQTDLAAGTEVTVRLQSTDSSSPFLQRTTTTVEEDGSFAITVDLSSLPTASEADATLRADGETVGDADVVIDGGDGNSGATDAPAEDSPFDFEGDAITLSAAPGQQISGQTDLAAGTEVSVQLQSSDTASPFLQRPTATVGEDGRFSVGVNLSGIEPGTEAEATLHADGETLGEADVVIEGDEREDATDQRDGDATDGDGATDDDTATDGDGATEDGTSDDDTATDSDTPSSGDATTDTDGDDTGMQDAGLVGGSVVGLLTLFGAGSRLLS